MKNKKNSNSTRGGIYIAVCCFAILAAAIGYAGRRNSISSPTKPENISSTDIVSKDTSPSLDIPTQFSDTEIADDVDIIVKDYIDNNIQKEPEEKPVSDEEGIAVSKTEQVTENEQTFLMPVDGTIVCAFSGDDLIYNEYFSDWRTHNGIDISCEKDSAIYATADGIVSEILDNSMGKSVLIEHENGYVSVYSNMSDEIEVKSGDKIKAGALIGKISDSNPSDFTKDYHLHFEILQNGKYLNPQDLLK